MTSVSKFEFVNQEIGCSPEQSAHSNSDFLALSRAACLNIGWPSITFADSTVPSFRSWRLIRTAPEIRACCATRGYIGLKSLVRLAGVCATSKEGRSWAETVVTVKSATKMIAPTKHHFITGSLVPAISLSNCEDRTFTGRFTRSRVTINSYAETVSIMAIKKKQTKASSDGTRSRNGASRSKSSLLAKDARNGAPTFSSRTGTLVFAPTQSPTPASSIPTCR